MKRHECFLTMIFCFYELLIWLMGSFCSEICIMKITSFAESSVYNAVRPFCFKGHIWHRKTAGPFVKVQMEEIKWTHWCNVIVKERGKSFKLICIHTVYGRAGWALFLMKSFSSPAPCHFNLGFRDTSGWKFSAIKIHGLRNLKSERGSINKTENPVLSVSIASGCGSTRHGGFNS